MKYIYSITFATLLFASCKKLPVEIPQFEVQVSRLVYKAGDTVQFKIQGSPGNISFYSGELGFKYANRDSVTALTGISNLQFTTALAGTAQANSLKVKVTNNLLGNDAESITKTNWTDITSRVTLASNSTSTSSGIIDLSEFAVEKGSFVLAFQYAASKATAAQPTWVIRSFAINAVFEDASTLAIATLADARWAAYDIKNPAAVWAMAADLRVNGAPANSPDNEDWLLTGPLNISPVKETGDHGLSIQNLAGKRLSDYSYVFKKPGVYKTTFVGFNNNISGTKEVIREFEFTIQP